MSKYLLFIYCLFSSFSVFSSFYESDPILNVDAKLIKSKRKKNFLDYPYNPHVPIDLWLNLKPYFLPINHPIKEKLDRIFCERVTLSEETFLNAGFNINRRHRPFNALVSGHKKLSGYLVKIYLDSQLGISDWEMWLKRIKGVEVIQACLKRHGYTQFVLPKKWIYPLPLDPSPPNNANYFRKNFILIVEDMHILNRKDNEGAYKQWMSKSLLKALYTVLLECQLTDCVYIGNMPFTKSGQISFVDTELYFNGIPDFQRFKKYLSISMQNYLDEMIQETQLTADYSQL